MPPEPGPRETAGITREAPETPERIMGRGLTAPETLAAFLLQSNSGTEYLFAEELALIYVEEAAAEGVNHDVAFAQMCLETGFLRYGGLVTAEMNNFCGLGAISPEQPGERFPTPRIGVRAHIQHLKAYATDEPPRQELVDPRYRWVRYGSAPDIGGLAGAWAADKEYGFKIKNILERLYGFPSIQKPDHPAPGKTLGLLGTVLIGHGIGQGYPIKSHALRQGLEKGIVDFRNRGDPILGEGLGTLNKRIGQGRKALQEGGQEKPDP
jgi:hypothetical protein